MIVWLVARQRSETESSYILVMSLLFSENISFKNSVQCSPPLVRQLHEAPDLPQGSINIEHSISHSGSWLCCFCSPGGLLKHLSDLWWMHLHGSGTGSTASISPASQTLLNVWVRETRRSPSPLLSFCNCKNSSGSPDDAAAAGQPLEGLKLRDFADDAACHDPHHPQTRDTVCWTGYMFVFWVSARCAVVLFVFLNFLLRVRAFRLDVTVFEKRKGKRKRSPRYGSRWKYQTAAQASWPGGDIYWDFSWIWQRWWTVAV